MSCQVEQIADCGDISSLGRALFISEKEGILLIKLITYKVINFIEFFFIV